VGTHHAARIGQQVHDDLLVVQGRRDVVPKRQAGADTDNPDHGADHGDALV